MIERTDLPAGMLSFPSIARYLREQLLYLSIAAVVAAVLWAIDQPYNNAGHPPPKLVSSNSIRELSGTGAVLGVFPAWKYENSIVALTSGDRLLLFTDGITEASGSDGPEFGEENLATLTKANNASSAFELNRRLLNQVTNFCKGQFHDGTTLLVIAVS